MGIKDKLMKFDFFKDEMLYKKYGENIHDMGLNETIDSGIVQKLMNARELKIPYCVVFGGIIPTGTKWDPYGNGIWNPPKDHIGTDDIATEENDREQEIKNIYAFLRGEEITKDSGKAK